MLTTREQLLGKIRLGEDSFLELKELRLSEGKIRGPSQEDLADELAAFANSSGGVLLIGVADTPREVVGIPFDKLDAVEALLRQACSDAVKPPLAPIIERLTLPDSRGAERPVIRVEVRCSLFVHQSPSGYMQRVGSSKRALAPDQLARLFQQRSQSRLIRFDETPVAAASLADLDAALWRRFAPEQSRDMPEILLSKLGMVARGEGADAAWQPTVAGLLMGSAAPQQFLRGAFIQAVAYRGTTVVEDDKTRLYQLDTRDITGPLDRQIFEACAFVRKNMKVAGFKRPEGGRVDVPQFEMRAVFEAVTNAVAHRDYSLLGSKIRLRLFADRLEIFSPGMLPNTMTPESLPFRQAARNETLTSLLARCPVEDDTLTVHRQHIMDKRGEGVSIILDESERLSGKRPEYRLYDESEVLLTIYSSVQE